MKRLLLALALLWTASLAAGAHGNSFELAAGSRFGQALDAHVEILADPSRNLDIEAVAAAGAAFEPSSGKLAFGFVNEARWIRATVRRPAGAPHDWLLEIPFPSLDDVRVYVPDSSGGWHEYVTGDHYPFAQRPLPYRHFVFPLVLADEAALSFYVRVDTADSMAIPLRMWSGEAFFAHLAQAEIVLALYYGVIIAMVIYNAFLGFALRDRTYIYYIGAALAILLTVMELNGHAFQWLWPNWLWMADNQHVLLPALHFCAAALWTRAFLQTRVHTPRADRALSLLIGLCAVLVALSLAGHYPLANQLVMVVGMLGVVIYLSCGIGAIRAGYAPARIFLLAQLALLAGGLAVVLRGLGLMAPNLLSEYGLQAGAAAEVILFSIALAQRVDLLRGERAAALHMAHNDALTGLGNRLGLDLRLAELLRQHAVSRQPFALLVVDLDEFKPVNDSWGHAVGDALLVEVGRRLQSCVRASDLVARRGGDEFVVLMPGMGRGAVLEECAAKIVAALAAPCVIEGHTLRVSASVGVASCPDDGDDPLELFKRADRAMYVAKAHGRNRYELAASPPASA